MFDHEVHPLQEIAGSSAWSWCCHWLVALPKAAFPPRHQTKLCAAAGGPIRYSDELGDDATSLLTEVKRRGLEGIIGKRADSVYEPGRRSGAWIKLKSVNEQEFVIGGYTPPGGARKHFGALLVGYDDKKKLLFAGKVGTGFDSKMLTILHKKLHGKERPSCLFDDLPSKLATGRVRPTGGHGKWT